MTSWKGNVVALMALLGGISLCLDSVLPPAAAAETPPSPPASGYAGSRSCRECHERFYQLRSTSIHGLAMQPYSETLAKEKLSLQKEDVVVGAFRYRAEIGEGEGWVLETGHVTFGLRRKESIEEQGVVRILTKTPGETPLLKPPQMRSGNC